MDELDVMQAPVGAGAVTALASAQKPKKSKKTKAEKKANALTPAAKRLLVERRQVVVQWRGRKITPEAAVAKLSNLSETDEDGTTWRLLPRPGGVALVRTSIDGVPTIVEAPVRYPLWPAVVGSLLIGALLAFAVWGALNPATKGEDPAPVTAPVSP